MAPHGYLITRGDDAGSACSANLAIREAFERGILRNASVMACAPRVEHAAATLSDLDGLCIGLHVTLTSEWTRPRWGSVLPPDRVPSLLDADNCFPANGVTLHERGPDLGEMVAEVEAQLARLRELGFRVEYMDQHMGIGWLPGLGEALRELCAREGLIETCGRFTRHGLPAVEGKSDDFVEQFAARLRVAPPETYVIIGHPAYDDAEMQAFESRSNPPGHVAARRDAQRRMFLAPNILDACRQSDFEPITYAQAARLASAPQ